LTLFAQGLLAPLPTFPYESNPGNIGDGWEGGCVVSPNLTTTSLKLGQNDQGNAFGLAHLIRRHPQMFHNDSQYQLITGYAGTNMGGLGQAPRKIREW
jgi:hypothetical protein